MNPPAAVLAVDGGNSKTDLLLLDDGGELLSSVRWGSVSHQVLGMNGARRALQEATEQLARDAGRSPSRPIARIGAFCLAGIDLPVDDEQVDGLLARLEVVEKRLLRNDTFAILRAGTDTGWGVALVCGAGMNAVGAAPDGRRVRFPALGPISGDGPGGGQWLGLEALRVAVRATDGRGRATALTSSVATHFGRDEPMQVTEALYTGTLSDRRLIELAPLVFDAAREGDEVARQVLDQLADEVIALGQATLRRLDLGGLPVPVVLGGGIFRSGEPRFLDRVQDGLLAVAPRADIHFLEVPPVLGAALLGFDALDASTSVKDTVRRLRPEVAIGVDGEVVEHEQTAPR